MASVLSGFSVPEGLSDVKKRASEKKNLMVVLAVIFVSAFIEMVASAHCADEIHKSSCADTDDHAKSAYRGAWISSVLGALVLLSVGGVFAFVVLRKPKST